MAFLQVDSLTAGYGESQILNQVSLSCEENSVTTLIGPNGAGKSTLLKSLMGYLQPSQGYVKYKAQDITNLKPNKRVKIGIAYVPQLDNVFGSLTVEENLLMGGYTLPRGTARKRMKNQLNNFPKLAERKRQHARTMSGGERQMLAMAKALMTDPDLLLLDEPSAALSPAIAGEIFQTIKTINGLGKTILIVEQNAEMSLAISQHCVVLVNGENALEAPADKVLTDNRLREAYLGG